MTICHLFKLTANRCEAPSHVLSIKFVSPCLPAIAVACLPLLKGMTGVTLMRACSGAVRDLEFSNHIGRGTSAVGPVVHPQST